MNALFLNMNSSSKMNDKRRAILHVAGEQMRLCWNGLDVRCVTDAN